MQLRQTSISSRPAGNYRPTSIEIVNEPGMQEQIKKIRTLVQNYMKIVDTTVRDITPKYIMLTLVRGTLDYIKDELTGDIFKEYQSEEAKVALLMASDDYMDRINSLLAIRDATNNALEVFSSLHQISSDLCKINVQILLNKSYQGYLLTIAYVHLELFYAI